MTLINNSQILGSGSTDLILNTRGKIYVKVGDRFYELDFKNEGNKEPSITNNTIIPTPIFVKKFLILNLIVASLGTSTLCPYFLYNAAICSFVAQLQAIII